MVFIGGPRQVGKTTLCLSYLNPPERQNPNYLNWDDLKSKTLLRKGEIPHAKLIVIDEIHKYKEWRNLLKGFYDKRPEGHNFLVTGSARLDHYRRGGDSLLGRYRYIRLHPLSIAELKITTKNDLKDLIKFGGFPEPYFAANENNHRLWLNERLHRVINDDIRDLEFLKEYNSIELLAEALPDRVGSPLSVKSLSEDLQVSPHTTERWIDILEKVYYCFRILPYGAPKIRAVKKERKAYLWDWSALTDDGKVFENLVASHLLKYCHYIEDSTGHQMELRFLKDTDGREIDFIVLKNKKPIFAVECKTGDKQLSKNINYFKERTTIPFYYQVHLGQKDYSPDRNVRVLPFLSFSSEVGLI
ncbi:MAG: AAA family ATPase [Bdellovibrionales bacterium RIFCSPHIGHO2_01_FULL_40_29]|nr:MAG: AAA family ATPase [Bdellovibrionales bacterium RIFCSPHIGHO2_01_FULL_40_29]OFZ35186.1 MAG: AAA family ATPase [Bdellovibrionales bacterium RIFCSPHIGHO2_02_FULL_40_15]